MKISQ